MVVKKSKPAAKKAVAAKKPAAKKVAAKKPAAKVAAKKPVAAVKKPARDNSPVKAAFTKSQILAELALTSELSKKQVSTLLEELTHLVSRHVKKGAVGTFNLPGVLKIMTVHKPATKARKGTNPFTGQETTFKAKPARTVVKVRALKGLKDMV